MTAAMRTASAMAVEESTLRLRLESLWSRSVKFWKVFSASRLGMIGLLMMLFFLGMALSAPVLQGMGLLRNPDELHLDDQYEGPSSQFIFGTDQLGRDLFSRLWWGSQATLLIGFAASAISMGLGTVIGLISGYYGGWVDELLMRIVDFFLVLPTLVLALILAIVLPPPGVSLWKIIFVIGISLWASTARLVRSQVLSLKERQFIERARAVGAGNIRIVFRHIFPNAFTLVFAEAILTVAVAILTESFLSFIALGPPEVITWGKILEDAYIARAYQTPELIWWVILPGIYIVAVVMAFTLLGFALDEVVNPRLRRR